MPEDSSNSDPADAREEIPAGPERTVVFLGSAAIAGAPVAYVIVLSAVVAVFSFIPFSIALSAGSSFPMAQGLYTLNGWLLGPWAGAAASGVGALVGVFLAPHTSGIPWITVGGAAMGAIFAGAIAPGPHRRRLAWLLMLLVALEVVVYGHHAIVRNGVRPWVLIFGYLTHVVAIALFVLPTRSWMATLIASPNLKRVALGLFLATWTAASLMMFTESLLSYLLLNWPEQLFIMFIGVIPLEHAARSGIGAVVGTGVIAGLRAMSLVKPREATY
ncbi:MAG TPA: hypothetical protein PLN52_16105 [Opitutaceae bacterium]|nr:hypothetical protein [Opitutaceae bacterium]